MFDHRAIVATFTNVARTDAYQLTAGGELLHVTRSNSWDVWSPPVSVAGFSSGVAEVRELLATFAADAVVIARAAADGIGAPLAEYRAPAESSPVAVLAGELTAPTVAEHLRDAFRCTPDESAA